MRVLLRMICGRRWVLAMVAALPALCIAEKTTLADDYPSSPIRIIVPFSAGGVIDTMARSIAEFLPKYLDGNPVVVENKPGAGTVLGHTYFLKQRDDGYTILATAMLPNLVNTIKLKAAPYKMSEFNFLNIQERQGFIVVVAKDRPYSTLGGLLDAIKENPGKVSTGQNLYSGGHLATVAMLDAVGLPTDSVKLLTYSGGGPSRLAVAGGQVDFMISSSNGAKSIEDKVNYVAQFAPESIAGFDSVPMANVALKEAGYPLLSEDTLGIQIYLNLATHASFVKNYPDRYKRLLGAYKEMVQSDEYQKYTSDRGREARWIGPERTNQIAKSGSKLLEKYIDMVK